MIAKKPVRRGVSERSCIIVTAEEDRVDPGTWHVVSRLLTGCGEHHRIMSDLSEADAKGAAKAINCIIQGYLTDVVTGYKT